MIDLSLFRFACPVPIRFADLDGLGHVNNAVYFTYMEAARLLYFREVIGWAGERTKLGVILARATCDFKLPLSFDDAIAVHIRITRLGHKSFDFEYAIVRQADQALAALGTTVQVAYDYKTNVSMPVPDVWREKVAAYEPGLNGSATQPADLRK